MPGTVYRIDGVVGEYLTNVSRNWLQVVPGANPAILEMFRDRNRPPLREMVMWAGEFGRLPVSQGPDGRDHNRHAFSLWLAGGGFGRGYVHGATDDFGYKSVEDVVNVHDLHATLLHALGLDHERLTFPHEGRDDTLTDTVVTNAQVVPALLDSHS